MFAQKFDEKIKHDYNDFNPVNRKSHMENQRRGEQCCQVQTCLHEPRLLEHEYNSKSQQQHLCKALSSPNLGKSTHEGQTAS